MCKRYHSTGKQMSCGTLALFAECLRSAQCSALYVTLFSLTSTITMHEHWWDSHTLWRRSVAPSPSLLDNRSHTLGSQRPRAQALEFKGPCQYSVSPFRFCDDGCSRICCHLHTSIQSEDSHPRISIKDRLSQLVRGAGRCPHVPQPAHTDAEDCRRSMQQDVPASSCKGCLIPLCVFKLPEQRSVLMW